MQSAKVEVVVPHGLKILLEGVSRAVIESNPDDLTQFFALYFNELVIFQKENPSMDITMLVENLDFSSENGNVGIQDEALEYTKTLFPGEPRQQDKGTDTEEDQLLEEFETEYSSKVTQYPSVPSPTAKSKSSIGPARAPSAERPARAPSAERPARAPSAERPELAYVPAEPAELAAHVLAMASSEVGQLPPHCNVWTLYCRTDLSQKSPHSLPHAGAGVSAPIYVMQEARKRENAPPFVLVGSHIHNTQDWKPLPGHAILAPQDAGARKRLTVVPVPAAWPADEEPDLAEETAAMPRTPSVFFVAIPLDDVMSAKKGSPDGDKSTGINALAGSDSTAG
ncbi:calcium-binding tyrosine phosphorylation-regulated protein [Caloenas nicobarica]|uniref:calcium-binding tyrosine phosphorylation-regulated protein n=1 Tax=Caloenas nicobarica TaxID=187106 RepID=UPI0032B76A73